MHYVYVLESRRNGEVYVGSTNDLRERFFAHNRGLSPSTRRYLPWALVYYETYRTEALARAREHGLKRHGNAMRELKKRAGLLQGVGLHPAPLSERESGAGFTLVELLVSIAIATLLTAIVIVGSLEARAATAVRIGAQEVAGFLREAAALTISGVKASGCDQAHPLCSQYAVKAAAGGTIFFRETALLSDRLTRALPGNVQFSSDRRVHFRAAPPLLEVLVDGSTTPLAAGDPPVSFVLEHRRGRPTWRVCVSSNGAISVTAAATCG